VTLKHRIVFLELLKDCGFRLPYLLCCIVHAVREAH